MEAALTPRPEEIPEAGAVREAMVTRTKTPDRGLTTPSFPKDGDEKQWYWQERQIARLTVGGEPNSGSSLTYGLSMKMAN